MKTPVTIPAAQTVFPITGTSMRVHTTSQTRAGETGKKADQQD